MESRVSGVTDRSPEPCGDESINVIEVVEEQRLGGDNFDSQIEGLENVGCNNDMVGHMKDTKIATEQPTSASLDKLDAENGCIGETTVSNDEGVQMGTVPQFESSSLTHDDRSSRNSIRSQSLGYGFELGDMVWGKVKSHPWWPGHIFSEAFASLSVRRTKRDGQVLVAFFGDSSYGWFDPAELIPFEPHFAEKSQQTTSRNFMKAVEESVDEACLHNPFLLCEPFFFRVREFFEGEGEKDTEKMEGSDSEASKVGVLKPSSSPSTPKFSLTFWEVSMATGMVASFAFGLLGVYLTLPPSDYSFLKLPRTLEDLQILRDHLESYTSDYTAQVLVGYCVVYIFMQTFMIPGTIFMSLLAGALFGVFKGMALVIFAATAGASSCYFLSKLIGRPLVFSLWPDKLTFFQAQVAKRRERLLNYMVFLRVTPTLPNTFINVASPIVDVPYHIFLFATFIGLIPAAFVTVRAGLALGELRSLGDLYDFQSIATLFLIGIVSVTPTLMSKKNS